MRRVASWRCAHACVRACVCVRVGGCVRACMCKFARVCGACAVRVRCGCGAGAVQERRRAVQGGVPSHVPAATQAPAGMPRRQRDKMRRSTHPTPPKACPSARGAAADALAPVQGRPGRRWAPPREAAAQVHRDGGHGGNAKCGTIMADRGGGENHQRAARPARRQRVGCRFHGRWNGPPRLRSLRPRAAQRRRGSTLQ